MSKAEELYLKVKEYLEDYKLHNLSVSNAVLTGWWQDSADNKVLFNLKLDNTESEFGINTKIPSHLNESSVIKFAICVGFVQIFLNKCQWSNLYQVVSDMKMYEDTLYGDIHEYRVGYVENDIFIKHTWISARNFNQAYLIAKDLYGDSITKIEEFENYDKSAF